LVTWKIGSKAAWSRALPAEKLLAAAAQVALVSSPEQATFSPPLVDRQTV
jgi:hypothetical protein